MNSAILASNFASTDELCKHFCLLTYQLQVPWICSSQSIVSLVGTPVWQISGRNIDQALWNTVNARTRKRRCLSDSKRRDAYTDWFISSSNSWTWCAHRRGGFLPTCSCLLCLPLFNLFVLLYLTRFRPLVLVEGDMVCCHRMEMESVYQSAAFVLCHSLSDIYVASPHGSALLHRCCLSKYCIWRKLNKR